MRRPRRCRPDGSANALLALITVVPHCAAVLQTGKQSSVNVPPDLANADEICGGDDVVDDCGGADWEVLAFRRLNDSIGLVRGFCVCTGFPGCAAPVCDATGTDCAVECKGGGCLSPDVGGPHGWACWHPCNFAHQAMEYGAFAEEVQLIREQLCTDLAPSKLYDTIRAMRFSIYGPPQAEPTGARHAQWSQTQHGSPMGAGYVAAGAGDGTGFPANGRAANGVDSRADPAGQLMESPPLSRSEALDSEEVEVEFHDNVNFDAGLALYSESWLFGGLSETNAGGHSRRRSSWGAGLS